MRFPFLFSKGIDNENTKENFRRVADYFRGNAVDKMDFRILEIATTGGVTDLNIPHRFDFLPTDAFITRITGGVTVTLNYDRFTTENVNITTSGATTTAVTIRLLIGRYNG